MLDVDCVDCHLLQGLVNQYMVQAQEKLLDKDNATKGKQYIQLKVVMIFFKPFPVIWETFLTPGNKGTITNEQLVHKKAAEG